MAYHYDAKDQMRIEDIITKAAKGGFGGRAKMLREQQFAGNMARAILDAGKAQRRGDAAADMGRHDLAKIFYVRYGQLTS